MPPPSAANDEKHEAGGIPHRLRACVQQMLDAVRSVARAAADLAELESLLTQTAADPAAGAALDVRFHARLAQAARNPLFTLVLEPLAGLLEQDRPLGLAGIGPAAALRDHRAILAAVRAGRPTVASAAMRRHLERVRHEVTA